LRLGIANPKNGWTTIRLSTQDVDLVFPASAVPSDSLADLAVAGNRLLTGETEVIVVWNSEPVECEFRFSIIGGRCRLEVREPPAGIVPIATVEAEAEAFARAIWRSFRRLRGRNSTEEFQAGWGNPFPTAAVDRLGDRLLPWTESQRRGVHR